MYQTVITSSNYIAPTILPWPDIFEDIKGAGITPNHLAEMMGKARSGIQRWLEGEVEPRESYARAIIAIHTIYCGEGKTQLRLTQVTYRE